VSPKNVVVAGRVSAADEDGVWAALVFGAVDVAEDPLV